jgi:hypothetical protein
MRFEFYGMSSLLAMNMNIYTMPDTGTSVSVFANGLESTRASCEFLVDGLHAGRYIGPGGTHRNRIFSSELLSSDLHTLEMHLSDLDKGDPGVSIDYILYNSTETVAANPGDIFIDNDSQSLKYSGQWKRTYRTSVIQPMAESVNRTLIGALSCESNVAINFSGTEEVMFFLNRR